MIARGASVFVLVLVIVIVIDQGSLSHLTDKVGWCLPRNRRNGDNSQMRPRAASEGIDRRFERENIVTMAIGANSRSNSHPNAHPHSRDAAARSAAYASGSRARAGSGFGFGFGFARAAALVVLLTFAGRETVAAAESSDSFERFENLILEDPGDVSADDRGWWAFRPLVEPGVPAVEEDDWSENPIDRFVFRRLKEQGLTPAPRADRTTLIRRLYFDVIGLPPSPEAVDAFLSDVAPDAWTRWVDGLLADPRHGEHWARFWLDLVRFAESDGWNQDAFRPRLWRYRDYVVGAFNSDLPFPDFVRDQLAGDELGVDDPDALAATGFLRLGVYEYNQRDAKGHWNDIMNEITDVTSDVFLGLGLACARCHDHKFDPLPQTDYFKLRAFFEPIIWRDDVLYATEEEKRAYERELAPWLEATREVRARIDALIKPYHERHFPAILDKFPLEIQACFTKPVSERNSWEQQMAYLIERQFYEEGGGPLKNMSKDDKAEHAALLRELASFDSIKPAPLPRLMAVGDFEGPPAATEIPGAGKREPIPPGFPEALSGLDAGTEDGAGSTGRRVALADWIADPKNPLTTRVFVNRIWQQHFGQGLVATPNDFGKLGQPPTHPELLDWLTGQFIRNGWSLKWLHRQILTSATWRQSARHPAFTDHQATDPSVEFLWRARVRRLTAETIRDAMLSVTGELHARIGGPSAAADSPRRSLYVKRLRNTPDAFLNAFDAANGLESVAHRNTTTTPTQALLLINDGTVLERAGRFADRLLNGNATTARGLLTEAFRLSWGRLPSEGELTRALAFLGMSPSEPAVRIDRIDRDALADFCHVLLNSSEFLYMD